MTLRRRVESLEVAYYRRLCTQYAPPGYTPERFLEAAIR